MNDQIKHYENKLAYEIDAWDAKDLIQRGERVVIVDARSAEAYKTEHISDAISLPHRTMTAESTAHLDRESLYIVYCDGIGCNASTKGALNLTRLGFRVKELMGGIDWWKQDGYATTAARCGDAGCGCGE